MTLTSAEIDPEWADDDFYRLGSLAVSLITASSVRDHGQRWARLDERRRRLA